MATPTILVNNSTGSDTLASGAGPTTALNGTGAALASSTSVDLSVDAPNLSGVATDGSAILWVGSTAGIQASIITAVNNGTKVVTVTTAFSVTQSGKNWAIGGKRATLDHATTRTILANLVIEVTTGLDVSIAYTGSDYTLSSALNPLSVNGQILRYTGTGATRPIICQTAAASALVGGTAGNPPSLMKVKFLQITNSHASHGVGIDSNGSNCEINVDSCILGDSTNQLISGIEHSSYNGGELKMWGSTIKNCTSNGINGPSFSVCFLYGCRIRNNVGIGVYVLGDRNGFLAIDTLVDNNTSHGFLFDQNDGGTTFVNCTIDSNGGDGIRIGNNPYIDTGVFLNNNVSNNTGYGINSLSGSRWGKIVDCNNFYNNTSGVRSNVNSGSNDIAVNPTYIGGGDYTPTNAALKVAFPTTFL